MHRQWFDPSESFLESADWTNEESRTRVGDVIGQSDFYHGETPKKWVARENASAAACRWEQIDLADLEQDLD